MSGINIGGSNLYKMSQSIYDYLKNKTFEKSTYITIKNKEGLNEVLAEGYEQGWGIPKAAELIKESFPEIEIEEANLIARTEINGAKNNNAYKQYFKDDIKYHQWWSAQDSNTRLSHAKVHGEIVELGTPFSNGLLYPGDQNGNIDEWVGCRCTTLAFIMPFGYMPPKNKKNFKEDELILEKL